MGPPLAFHAPLEEIAFALVHETVALVVGIYKRVTVSSGDCHKRRAPLSLTYVLLVEIF